MYGFNSQLTWLENKNQNDLMIVPEDQKERLTIHATCAVVGIKSTLESSKTQFSLIAPPIDNVFNSDFQLGIEHIKTLQNKVVSTGPQPKYFLIEDGEQTGMRFSCPLFEKRDFEYDSQDDEDWSNDYPIDTKYKPTFKAIIEKWRVTPLPAYDKNGKFIRVRDQENYLKGSLVLVYFQLKHYGIREKDSNSITSNTFTAVTTQIKILQRAPKRNASPYKSQLLKGPVTLPTSPSRRSLQVEAVKAFHAGSGMEPSGSKASMAGTGPEDTNGVTTTITNIPDVFNHSIAMIPHVSTQDTLNLSLLSKTKGKKRAMDDNEEAPRPKAKTQTQSLYSRKRKRERNKQYCSRDDLLTKKT
ncbi:hypothetical protein BYT27DRAFT_7215789 [Phlegmacium glaucopus]|nr:hypothetical protein BYT27DRAFT_7215789 [Phlegmacium glaucopus]